MIFLNYALLYKGKHTKQLQYSSKGGKKVTLSLHPRTEYLRLHCCNNTDDSHVNILRSA